MKLFLFLLLLIPSVLFGQSLPLLKLSDNKRYFVTEDEVPFLWLGGTAWELIHRLNREEIDTYLKDRKDKGFTIVQTVILAELDGLNTPNAYGNKPLLNNDPTRINEEYFEHVDYVLNKAEELGLYVGLLPTWGDKFNLKWGVGPVIFTPENAEICCHILAKRYLDQKNLVWILGGDRMPETEEQMEIVRAMAKGIRSIDQQHLITYHPSGSRNARDSIDDNWLDFDMFQTGHDTRVKDYDFVRKSWQLEPPKPIVNGEPRYENSPERFWEPGEHEWMDDADVRSAAYWSLLSGAAGFTYGCHDIWQMYEPDREPVNSARTGWKEAMQLSGARQIKYLNRLFTLLPWYELEYNPSLIISENPQDRGYIVSAINKKKSFIIAYTPQGRPVDIDLSDFKSHSFKAVWYNPRSGEVLEIGQYKHDETITFTPWATGNGSDFVLILTRDDLKIDF